MKVRLAGVRSVLISGDHIELDKLLKFANIASTGGEAKLMILSGEAVLNGETCLSRGKKIKPCDVVRCRGDTLVVKRRGDL